MLGLTAALLSLLATPVAPQADGVTLMAKVDPGADCNDIWGYTAPNGDEYALVGTVVGTSIYNCTNPSAPYLVASISGPGSIWRDIETYGNYAYVVTEGGGGIQIIDMNDPENPFLVKTWGAHLFSNCHNIGIDQDTGMIYACGTSAGTVIFDGSASATSPPHVTNYSSRYVHDLHIQDGYAHMSEIYEGNYRIIDVRNLPSLPSRDRITTPGYFTHSTWVNENNTLCITTDEVNGGRVALYDISNKTDIKFRDHWTPDSSTIPHNAYIIGDKAYVSWYTEGFICLDISDPYDIKKYASYDTSSYTSGSGYHGAWGCYPFSPSGVVYISDIEEGFYILSVEGPAIDLEHTELANTTNQTGPYPMSVTAAPVHAGSTVTDVDIWYHVEGGSWQSFALAQTGNTDEWTGDFPGQLAPAVVEYYIHATESGGRRQWLPAGSNAGDMTYNFIVGNMMSLYFNDFEGANNEGWAHGSTAGVDDFERGTPQGKSGIGNRHEGVRWNDPVNAYSGSKIWANDLGTGNDDGAYNESSNMWLESPSIDCTGAARTTLVFWRWASFEGGGNDHAKIWVNNDQVWTSPAYTGEALHTTDVGWTQMVIDISNYADNNSDVKVRFELETDNILNLGGWGIDNFEIVALEQGEPTDTILLTGPTSANTGAQVQYNFSAAPANASYSFLYSLSAAGSVHAGHQFNLGNPITTLANGTMNAQGAGSFSSIIPSGASGLTVYLEVAAWNGGGVYDSNMLTLVVN
jgi:choice-of-anchor B domain-containing protein